MTISLPIGILSRSLFSIVASCGLLASLTTADAGEQVRLWPKEPPGYQVPAGEEKNMSKPNDGKVENKPVVRIGNVSTPTVEVFLPDEGKRSGAAVIICPGGGFNILALDLEGTEVAEWFVSKGIVAVVLKYRVPTNPYKVNWEPPAQDAQRAVRWVRSQADKWGVEKNKVGLLGFSAGGCTAARATTHQSPALYEAIDEIDRQSARPDFTMLIYPAYLVNKDGNLLEDLKVDSQMPPVFISHAFDDPVRPENALALYSALKKAGVASELHLYDSGGHGYGLRTGKNPAANWPKRCEEWLQRKGLVKQ